MNKDFASRLLDSTFNAPFDEERFNNFAVNLLNDLNMSTSTIYLGHDYIKTTFRNHIVQYKRLGSYIDTENEAIDVLIVQLKNEWALERSRTMIRNFTADYLKNVSQGNAALVAYYTKDLEDWRFSYIRLDNKLEETESGRIKVYKELTPSKRYSFLVGVNEPNHTAQNQLLPILEEESTNPKISEIESAFSVDSVSKQFYLDYRELYESLNYELKEIVKSNDNIATEFQLKSISTENFAKKLLGQIVFLYFIQKKGWLGVEKDEEWGTGPKKFVQNLFHEKSNYKNFYSDVLEPLFYHALAEERGHDYYNELDCKIPFLNGGLFETINEFNWKTKKIQINNDLIDDIFSTFDRYNFTVREADPLEVDLAIDPEMLGKVFENLLPENLRKGKGAYYTPRTIVHYMCQESLINYLDTECSSVPIADIITLIREGDIILELERANREEGTSQPVLETIKDNARTIDDALASIKICDPAIGSGAFPVGMLNEIVKARTVLDFYLGNNQTPYTLKRHCIQESLYGVDIDPGAIAISRLRLWLSLVVDEQDYNEIQTLPNLDYKIMQGNSLVEESHGISLDMEKKPDEAAIFNIFHYELEKKKHISPRKSQEIETDIKGPNHGNKERNFFPWKLYFAEVFRENGGFDVIIANPPYVFTRDVDFGVNFKKYVEKVYFQKIKTNGIKSKANQSGKINLFALFLLQSLFIQKENGYQMFILPNSILRTTTYNTIRKFLLINKSINFVADLGSNVFDKITTSTILLGVKNSSSKEHTRVITKIEDLQKNIYEEREVPQSQFLSNVSYAINIYLDNKGLELSNKIIKGHNKLGCYCSDIMEGIVAHKHLISLDPIEGSKPLVEGRTIKKYYLGTINKNILWDKKLIHRPRPDYIWEAEKKIIIQRISGGTKPLKAAIDKENQLTFASVNNLLLHNEYNRHYEYILCLLNSNLLNWFYANNFSNNSELTVNISKTYLEMLPIPYISANDNLKFSNLIRQILYAKKASSEADITILEAKIDQMVYKLYGLKKDEIAIVEESVG